MPDRTIDVAVDFYPRLVNRDEHQGDGKHTAFSFRERFLKNFDAANAWKSGGDTVTLDFKDIKKIGPSFANEAFAFFTKYAKPEDILAKIQFKNISAVQKSIIEEELRAGYATR